MTVCPNASCIVAHRRTSLYAHQYSPRDGHKLWKARAGDTQPAGHRTTRLPFITQAEFHGSRGLRELSVSTTGATTTLAGRGAVPGIAFKDDAVGTNVIFRTIHDIAIAPSGDFALVVVRAWPPAPRAPWPSPAAGRTRLAHTPQARTAALQGLVPATTHRATGLLLAQRVLARARCIAGHW